MTVHDVARGLPDIPTLRDLCRSMAMLEAVLNPDGERYYSYSRTWSDTDQIASMRNGSGDELDIVFAPAGAYILAFDHESPMSPYADDLPWPGVVDPVPAPFRAYVDEPAFTDEDMPRVTACLWRETDDEQWRTGDIEYPDNHPDPDGSGWMFRLLTDATPAAFQAFAEDYYETAVDIDVVRHVYAHRPLNRALTLRLNPEASMTTVAKEATKIGYPLDADSDRDRPKGK
ncbi:hypothetical protein CG723_30010 [Streptomyces sp. CB01635]|uniref:hypothetical protein n=1 Tax=unclassified Streptomyces TaxID=2593676 RepID=UPI000C27D4C8|nr:hypothetical protein [Streptomyces sp. CB01635]PJN08237.1 hypothetical protein CG723_30010 [Streptomyces sp. CB01635]